LAGYEGSRRGVGKLMIMSDTCNAYMTTLILVILVSVVSVSLKLSERLIFQY
jgi:hypothetical protein